METWSAIHEEKNEFCRGEKIKEYISANLSTDLSAKVVSTLPYSSKNHLLQNYHLYIEKVRVHKAMEMIWSGKRFREIMASTGYKSRVSFYQAFKELSNTLRLFQI